MLTITIIDTHGSRMEYQFPHPETGITLGRDPGSRIVLQDDVVSQIHGELTFTAGRLAYRDLNSSNGTLIVADGRTKKLDHDSSLIALPDPCALKIGSRGSISRQVMILIEQKENDSSWSVYPLGGSPVRIGSSPDCSLTISGLAENAGCLLWKNGPDCLIRPEGPAGLRINGADVFREQTLQDNDYLEIAGQLLIYTRGNILFRPASDGLSLSGFHITKTVPGTGGRKKKILNDVSLNIEPNQFTAIIGGSGAGKTTLMNALSGFEPEFEGEVLAGGISLKSHFDELKHLIGFVPQQDILYENLTLSKMLNNAARLRMPPKTGVRKRRSRVDEVLAMVDLQDHKNTVISKLSGGQKKRASIAVELLADPKLFFLDEPSSGLDPGTEKSLMIMLNHLAREQKKTIVMVTHNITNLDLCDQVLFMEPGGRLAYAGPAGMARDYFRTPDLADVYPLLGKDKDGQWAARFDRVRPETKKEAPDPTLLQKEGRDSSLRQLSIFCDRYFTLLFRDPKRLLLLFGQPVFMALVLWMVASEDTFQVFNATQSILFSMTCAAIWLGLFDTIQEICKERVIIHREYMSKLRLLPYLGAKFLVSSFVGLVQAVLLGTLFLATCSILPSGIFTGSPYPEVILTLWLTILASQALGFVFSALAKSGEKAMTYAPLLLIVQLLFSGILFKLKGLGEIIADLTISKWSVQALGAIADLNSLPTSIESEYPNLNIEREINEAFNHTASNLSLDWIILILMTVAGLVLTLVFLRRIKKDRR